MPNLFVFCICLCLCDRYQNPAKILNHSLKRDLKQILTLENENKHYIFCLRRRIAIFPDSSPFNYYFFLLWKANNKYTTFRNATGNFPHRSCLVSPCLRLIHTNTRTYICVYIPKDMESCLLSQLPLYGQHGQFCDKIQAPCTCV